jgi:hypothetical protein
MKVKPNTCRDLLHWIEFSAVLWGGLSSYHYCDLYFTAVVLCPQGGPFELFAVVIKTVNEEHSEASGHLW